MVRILASILLAFICFEIIDCVVKHKKESSEPKSGDIDIKVFGKKIKLNILEVKEDYRGKNDEFVEELRNKLGLNRKKRSPDESSETKSSGSDNSMMGGAQKMFNQAKSSFNTVAKQAADTFKKGIDTVKNTFTG